MVEVGVVTKYEGGVLTKLGVVTKLDVVTKFEIGLYDQVGGYDQNCELSIVIVESYGQAPKKINSITILQEICPRSFHSECLVRRETPILLRS